MGMLKAFFTLGDLFASRLFPFVPSIGSAKDISEENFLRETRKTLFHNLSALLEYRFREEVYAAVTGWHRQTLSYDEASKVISSAFAERNKFLGRITPSQGITRTLMASGFFFDSFMGNKTYPWLALLDNRQLVARLGILLKVGVKKYSCISRDINSIRAGKTISLSKVSIDYLHSSSDPNLDRQLSSSRYTSIAILGNAEIDSSRKFEDFDYRIVLVTLNTDVSEVIGYQQSGPLALLLNGEFVESLLCADSKALVKWRPLLSEAQRVFVKGSQKHRLKEALSISAFSSESPLLTLWSADGAPNLAQIAVGLAMEMFGGGARIAIFGVNMYAGHSLYSSKQKTHAHSESQSFGLCRSLAMHDPVKNFVIMKILAQMGYAVGPQEFLEISNMSLEEYLEILDKRLGSLRL